MPLEVSSIDLGDRIVVDLVEEGRQVATWDPQEVGLEEDTWVNTIISGVTEAVEASTDEGGEGEIWDEAEEECDSIVASQRDFTTVGYIMLLL